MKLRSLRVRSLMGFIDTVNKTIGLRVTVLAVAIAGSAGLVNATQLTTNDFSYTGALTNNGWVAYSGADGSITANGSVAQIGSGTEDIRLPFADQTTNPTYASFIMNVATLPASGGEYSFGFSDSSSMDSRFGIAVTGGGTTFRLTAYGAGSAVLATTPSDLALSSNYVVLVYFDGVSDHRLWVNPVAGGFNSPDAQASGANSGIDGFFIRQAGVLDNGDASWSIDNHQVATTYEDLVTGIPVATTNVSFTMSADSVDEDVGTYLVTVTKSLADGNVSGEITLAGTATEGVSDDYTIDTTNFVMNGATTSATFTITINDDADPESAETIELSLANVIGGTVSTPSTFTLTINLNDTPPASIIISQYTDTESGTTPKGIELWNVSGGDITFDGGANKLDVLKGVNGAALALDVSVTNGTVTAGDVFVIGTSDMSPDFEYAFTYNGDDALQVQLGGIIQDTFGEPGNDPGSAWSGNGVSTADQNIELLDGITTGDIDGWSDPSIRFTNVSVGSVLTGFGVPPGSAPPTNVAFSLASAIVNESVGSYTVTVTKSLSTGNVIGQVVLGGDAVEGGGNDYTIDTTNFVMNGATVTADLIITINDDGDTEPAETITLTLANVDGGTIASPSVFTLTINPSDIPPEGIVDFRFNSAPYLQATSKDANITVSNLTLTTGGAIQTDITTGTYFPDEPYVQAGGGWTADSQASAKAFEFTIIPAPGYKVSVTGISFSAYATGSGPSAFGYNINAGGATFAADMPDSTLQSITNAVTGVDNITSPIGVLIQGWTNGTRLTTGSGDFRLDDVVIFGRVELVGGGGSTTLDQYDISGFSQAAGTFSVTINVSSNGVPYTLIYSTNLLTDTAPAGTGTADTQNGNGGALILQDTTPANAVRSYWIRSNN